MHQNFCTTVLQLTFDGFEGLSESESAWCKNNSYCTALTKPEMRPVVLGTQWYRSSLHCATSRS